MPFFEDAMPSAALPDAPAEEAEARRAEVEAALPAESVDLDALTEQVYRLLVQEARLARERLGRF